MNKVQFVKIEVLLEEEEQLVIWFVILVVYSNFIVDLLGYLRIYIYYCKGFKDNKY